MINGFPKAIYGRPGRDEEIREGERVDPRRRRGRRAVVEYNFYSHRLDEGYYEELGAAGAGMTAYDYDRSKDLPPLPDVGVHSLDAMWKNVTYFLKAVVPVAEQPASASRSTPATRRSR